jgi:type I restriction enzyme M protein
VQLIDASSFWQKMRKSLGSKRKELNEAHIEDIARLFGAFDEVTRVGVPISRIFRNEAFGYRTITVERPQRDDAGQTVLATKGKGKGKPVPDAWIDHEKTKVGYEIPFNRHFYVFKPPRPLTEIDADLKVVTDRILTMIGELSK